MAIDRYEIVNTCGGHCFITELDPAGDMVYFEDHSTAVASLLVQRDQLLAACKAACEQLAAGPQGARTLAQLRRAIAVAEGGAA